MSSTKTMSDTFHADAPRESLVGLAQAIRGLGDGHKHVVMMLTKLPANLLRWQREHFPDGLPPWVWVGCTVEDQRRADERVPVLLQVRAAVRFLSVEPMLSAVDVSRWLPPVTGPWGAAPPASWGDVTWPDWVPARVRNNVEQFWSHTYGRGPSEYAYNAWFGSGAHDDPPSFGALASLRSITAAQTRVTGRYVHAWNNIGWVVQPDGQAVTVSDDTTPTLRLTEPVPGQPGRWQRSAVSWVICGGESGPEARPMRPDWARSLRDQCVAAGVPFHFKQWGEWREAQRGEWRRIEEEVAVIAPDGRKKRLDEAQDPVAGDRLMIRVGKLAAGRILDGRTWDEVPS